jgi:hypothetical protein
MTSVMPPSREALRAKMLELIDDIREEALELTAEGAIYDDDPVRVKSARALLGTLRTLLATARTLPRVRTEETVWEYDFLLRWVQKARSVFAALPTLTPANIREAVSQFYPASILAGVLELDWNLATVKGLRDTAPSKWLIQAIASRDEVSAGTVKDRIHRRAKPNK